eukprot:3368950-Amphidinium_carterae.1
MAPTHKKWQVHTILTGVEITTGLCLLIPTTQLKKFVMENGFKQLARQSYKLTMSGPFYNLHKKLHGN